jgi:hypothetical protein
MDQGGNHTTTPSEAPMKHPLTMSVTIVQMSAEEPPYAWVSVGESDPSPVRITAELKLSELDEPAHLHDFARQVLAQVCEAI